MPATSEGREDVRTSLTHWGRGWRKSDDSAVRMYADRTRSKACALPRRFEMHLRKALVLPKRRRGAQPGNRNRLRHGFRTHAAKARRAEKHVLLGRARQIIARTKRMARELNALLDGKPHGAAVGKPMRSLLAQDRREALIEFGVRQFEKPVARVEGRVPGDMTEGRQGQRVQAPGTRPDLRRVDQCAP